MMWKPGGAITSNFQTKCSAMDYLIMQKNKPIQRPETLITGGLQSRWQREIVMSRNMLVGV